MKNFLKQLDFQDVTAITGLAMLGYGLFLFNPPLMYVVIGTILLLPSVLPLFRRTN